MALIARHAHAGMDASTATVAPQISGFLAGEDLDIAAPCYINNDELVYMCDATANDAKARPFGFTARNVKEGEPVTLFGAGVRFRYTSDATASTRLYIAATAGRLDDAATTGDAEGVAVVINANEILITRADAREAGA